MAPFKVNACIHPRAWPRGHPKQDKFDFPLEVLESADFQRAMIGVPVTLRHHDTELAEERLHKAGIPVTAASMAMQLNKLHESEPAYYDLAMTRLKMTKRPFSGSNFMAALREVKNGRGPGVIGRVTGYWHNRDDLAWHASIEVDPTTLLPSDLAKIRPGGDLGEVSLGDIGRKTPVELSFTIKGLRDNCKVYPPSQLTCASYKMAEQTTVPPVVDPEPELPTQEAFNEEIQKLTPEQQKKWMSYIKANGHVQAKKATDAAQKAAAEAAERTKEEMRILTETNKAMADSIGGAMKESGQFTEFGDFPSNPLLQPERTKVFCASYNSMLRQCKRPAEDLFASTFLTNDVQHNRAVALNTREPLTLASEAKRQKQSAVSLTEAFFAEMNQGGD